MEITDLLVVLLRKSKKVFHPLKCFCFENLYCEHSILFRILAMLRSLQEVGFRASDFSALLGLRSSYKLPTSGGSNLLIL